MRANATPAPPRKDKRRLLESCAIAAGIAALAYGGPALAQVQANSSFVTGNSGASINNSGTTTSVTVTQAQSIINWVPIDSAATGGDINILAPEHSWNFTGPVGYTVLNRFVNSTGGAISRTVSIDGFVNSFVDIAGLPPQQGGNIWFYNAGGILIGANGAINVGSLVLTANNIDTTGGLFGPGGEIRFRGTAASASAITVNGTIDATNPFNPGNSYVALVAPRVVQAGAIGVDGSAALVAAEQADITINNGLFNINVLVGAEGGNVITHTGTTGGPAHQQGDVDQSRIYMVAIPKNEAVTMLVSGQVGYDDAVSAQLDPDGAVVLSAGYNIVNGAIDAAPVNATAANITVNDTIFHSDTTAHASGAFVGEALQQIPPPGPPVAVNPNPQIGVMYVRGNGLFIGDQSATLNVGAGQGAGALGDLTVQSNGTDTAPGNALVNVSGGQLAVGGNLNILAFGQENPVTGVTQGGNASFVMNAGTATIADGIAVVADGTGSSDTAGDGGVGRGGDAVVDLLGGTLVSGEIRASASGFGGVGTTGSDENPTNITPGGAGGGGYGGSATITIDGTANVEVDNLIAEARGSGGTGGAFFNVSSFGGNPGTPGDGGLGQGGTATITVADGTLNAGDDVVADASGIGGTGGLSFFSSSSGGATGTGVGGRGGDGRGGTATIGLGVDIFAGALPRSIAQGIGGNGGIHNVGGNGGDGFGGTAQAIVTGFDQGILSIILDSSALGGNGGNANDGAGGSGGNATGGTARLRVEGAGGAASIADNNFVTDGTGGNGGNGGLAFAASPTVAPSGGNGGNGTGGTIEIVARDTATITIRATNSSAIALMDNLGIGGNGGDGASSFFSSIGGDGGDGGAGTGGTISLSANGGTITSSGNTMTLATSGIAGAGGTGGDGPSGVGAIGATSTTTGGSILIEAINSSSSTGQILFPITSLVASGDAAGRIVLRGNGLIETSELTATANGAATPTNNDIDTATAGIFLAPVGGSITTTGLSFASTGELTLTTDGSVGIYAEGDGAVNAVGAVTIQAGDQIDIRHAVRGNNTASTISAGGNLSATAGTSINGTPDSLVSTNGMLSLNASGAVGMISVDHLDAGTDILINSTGATSVEHAEAAGNFTAEVGSFRTGLNSIITGGNIEITSPGAINLGNSTAGGFVQVSGQTVDFNSVTAGLTVNISDGGFIAGSQGVRGGSITAGGNINIFGSSIDLTGPITSDDSFFAVGINGDLAVDQANVAGTISTFSSGNTTGNFVAGGDIFLNADGNVTASAQANGGYPDFSGLPTDGNLFVDAIGDVTLTDSSAARMFGVRTDGAASITGSTAGEDMLVLAGTTASLTNVMAGDDLRVNAPGNITAQGASTTGAGPDTRILEYSVGSSSGVFTISVGEGSLGTDGSDIVMASAAGAIDASALSAGDDILLSAATTIAVNGATTLGLGTTGGDSSIRTQGGDTALADLDSFSDVGILSSGIVSATGTVAAGRDIAITAASADFDTLTGPPPPPFTNTLQAAGNLTVTTDGAITGGRFEAGGDLSLTGSNIDITRAATTGAGLLSLVGATGVNSTNIQAGGEAFLYTDAGAVTTDGLLSTGPVTVFGDSVAIQAGGDIVFSDITANAGDASVVNQSGSITVDTADVAGTATLSGTDGVTIGQLTANTANIDTGGDLSILTSLAAQNISLVSADIILGSNATIGQAGLTQNLSIENGDVSSPTYIGGTGTRNGYHIDADELTRIYGTNIAVVAPEVQDAGGASVGSSAPPDVIVDTFAMTGGASNSNLGANGSLTLTTPGKMRVIGNVQLTGLTNDNGLNLFADDALEVILGQGTVRLLNGNAPAGRLTMVSDDVIVATTAAITAVGAATTTDAINARLSENDGVTLDEGALFARSMVASVAGGFYVQNSGTGTDFDQRRGLTFGEGGLTIATSGPASRIVINGVHLGANGQVTGIDAISLLTIAPQSSGVPGTYDPRSTFNGCFIANPSACSVPSGPQFENNFPVQDVIEEQSDVDEEGDGNSLPQPLITIRDLDPLTGEPLLDDPVTGAGNDDLWIPTTDQP